MSEYLSSFVAVNRQLSVRLGDRCVRSATFANINIYIDLSSQVYNDVTEFAIDFRSACSMYVGRYVPTEYRIFVSTAYQK